MSLVRRFLGPRAGAAGEDLACAHLEARGFQVLARNYRCRGGEVDIVAREGDVTAFVEVKDRSGRTHGEGYESVNQQKRRRIVLAARRYAARAGLWDAPLRFDVVTIDRSAGGAAIRHDRGAFDESGR